MGTNHIVNSILQGHGWTVRVGNRQLEQLEQLHATTKQLLPLASFHHYVNYSVFISKQATSALAGLLEEDAIATDESKIIDNAWRGAEVN